MSTERTGHPRGGTSPVSTSWELPRDSMAARVARRELARGLRDLPRDVVQVAQILTSELVTNALNHGQGPITCLLVRNEGTVTVRVADQGSQLPEVGPRDVATPRGRGLQLVEALAASWGIELLGEGGGGKVVWFTLRTAPVVR